MTGEFKNNGMARCGVCGEPSVPVLIGDPREVEQNPNITVRCFQCSMVEEAEKITGDAA
jgi:hypothetical protein